MAKRFKYIGTYRPFFLRQWREYRGLSLETLADAIVALDAVTGGLTKASLSRIETGRTPYNRDTLEVYAVLLGCEPIDLLTRPPPDPQGAWSIWNRLAKGEGAIAGGRRRYPRNDNNTRRPNDESVAGANGEP